MIHGTRAPRSCRSGRRPPFHPALRVGGRARGRIARHHVGPRRSRASGRSRPRPRAGSPRAPLGSRAAEPRRAPSASGGGARRSARRPRTAHAEPAAKASPSAASSVGRPSIPRRRDASSMRSTAGHRSARAASRSAPAPAAVSTTAREDGLGAAGSTGRPSGPARSREEHASSGVAGRPLGTGASEALPAADRMVVADPAVAGADPLDRSRAVDRVRSRSAGRRPSPWDRIAR